MPAAVLQLPVHPTDSEISHTVLYQVCSLADQGDIDEAGQRAQRLLASGAYDYQLVTVWLAYRFSREGLAVLADLLDAARIQVALELERLKPEADVDRGRAIATALCWLTTDIERRASFGSRERGETWRRWVAQLEEEPGIAERVEHALELLAGTVDPLIDAGEAVLRDELKRFERRFRETFGGVAADIVKRQARRAAEATHPADDEATGEQSPADDTASAATELEARVDGDEPDAPEDEPQEWEQPHHSMMRQLASTAERAQQDTIPCSEPLAQLRRKLTVFEQLAANGAWEGAAIVHRRIESELASFDPLRYLPDVFSGYLAVLHQAGEELEPYIHEAGDLRSQALERLYVSDPDGFLARASGSEGRRG